LTNRVQEAKTDTEIVYDFPGLLSPGLIERAQTIIRSTGHCKIFFVVGVQSNRIIVEHLDFAREMMRKCNIGTCHIIVNKLTKQELNKTGEVQNAMRTSMPTGVSLSFHVECLDLQIEDKSDTLLDSAKMREFVKDAEPNSNKSRASWKKYCAGGVVAAVVIIMGVALAFGVGSAHDGMNRTVNGIINETFGETRLVHTKGWETRQPLLEELVTFTEPCQRMYANSSVEPLRGPCALIG